MLIAALEQRTGLSRDTIRFYERAGLITPPVRGANSYRHYDEHTLVELNFVRKAQDVGFTLDEIRPAIPFLRNAHAPCCQELYDGLINKRGELLKRIEEEQRRLATLDAMIAGVYAWPERR